MAKSAGRRVRVRRLSLGQLDHDDALSVERVLATAANATVFHTAAWNRLLVEQFGLRDVTLLATVDDEPVGLYTYYPLSNHLCRSSLVNLQSAYGGPLATLDDPRIVAELLGEGERLQPFHAFQVWTPPGLDLTPFREMGYGIQELQTPVLSLAGGEDGVWSKLHRNKRRAIAKATQRGVTIEAGDRAAVDEYYGLVSETLGQAGIEVLPKAFYERLLKCLGPLGNARLFLARFEGSTVAGAIILYHGDTAYGWDMGWRRQHANLGANDLLNWEAMRLACRDGYRQYDLLRLDADQLPGIAQWKSGFGGDILPCYFAWKRLPGHRVWRALTRLSRPAMLLAFLRRGRWG